MFPFLKSLSRIVHEESCVDPQEQPTTPSISTKIRHDHEQQAQPRNDPACTSLTVWRKSLLVNCHGFTVIDSYGNLVYRVDNYCLHPREVTLMDGDGKPIITIHRRKRLGPLLGQWVVYEGEVSDYLKNTNAKSRKKPICYVKRHIGISQAKYSRSIAYVSSGDKKRHGLVIEGSYVHRSCKVVEDGSRKAVAEIRRKETSSCGGVSFGLEVFRLIVQPGFDAGLAMALVLLLDQMFS